MKREKDTSCPDTGSEGFSCELPVAGGASAPPAGTGVFKYRGGGEWDGVATSPYKQGGAHWDRVLRRVLVGEKGEPTAFHVRYFEIEKGGFSSLERHRHVHVVIGVRGLGEVRIGNSIHPVAPFDVAVVGSGETHQLVNRNEEPFGFFCIVDADRDAPVVVQAGFE